MKIFFIANDVTILYEKSSSISHSRGSFRICEFFFFKLYPPWASTDFLLTDVDPSLGCSPVSTAGLGLRVPTVG